MALNLNLIPDFDAPINATRWRSLKLYNGYRLLLTFLLILTQDALDKGNWWQDLNTDLLTSPFSSIATYYFIFSLIAFIFTWLEKPNLNISVTLQILADIAFIVLLMHVQESSQGSIGLLLIIAIASASLISDGRLALFYAALASIGILLAQTYRVLFLANTSSSYTPAVMLSLGCFATAWLAYSLAKRAKESEMLASQRGLDVQNMAQINALITDEMQDGVLVIDEHVQIKHYNNQAKVLLGFEGVSWQEKSLEHVSTEVANIVREWMEESVAKQGFEKTRNVESFIKLSALSRELRLRILPIDNQNHVNGRKQGAVIFIEDWSQMQTQAHQVKLAALGRLTANIAHEIRNPLSAISHANQLLQEEDFSPAIKRMLQIIGDNVLRVDQIIKDVLELNRRDRTNQERIHLENFTFDFYTQFCAVEKIPQAGFKLSLMNAETMISFDRRHLNQILWNLCKNGWRHCKKNDSSLELNISLTEKTRAILIEVRDDGDGVPENIRGNLFEPFFTTEKSGTGLGLYIASELADANGAKLEYQAADVAMVTGSIFRVHLKKTQ
jgi:two-component system, NtrC family, sensor histidine kinase PilS